MACTTKEVDKMWQNACLISRLVASSVRISEAAGDIIKKTMSSGDLKTVNKSEDGKTQDLQTEADRTAQYCIEKSLQQKFGNGIKVIGEEEVTTSVPIVELGVSAEVLEQDHKCQGELREIKEKDLVVWVDPLDGTSEFAEAVKTKNFSLLQQVTVLIGIAHKGRSLAGVVHQPYYNNGAGRTIWGINGAGTFGVDIFKGSKDRTIVTTRSHFTQLVQESLDILKQKNLATDIERVGGAGFKVLKCLEGAAAYVFASAGCKKWDTAAPEALLIAAGGKLTDISGRYLYYGPDAQHLNSGGVVATAPWVNHQEYIDAIPEAVKNALPESLPKA